MSADSRVRIGLVFPELLGTYGDRGNAVVLRERLTSRGIDATVVDLPASEPLPDSLDCYVIGGGEDHAEVTAAPLLRASPLRHAWEQGACVVGICAGYQLLGTAMTTTDGTLLEGLGIVDAATRPGKVRHVGNTVVIPTTCGLGPIAGFENHRGVTTLGPDHQALGTIGRSPQRDEGVIAERIVGTYLHGPVLVGNPELTDHVLRWIVGELAPIARGYQDALHDEWVERGAPTTHRWSSKVTRLWRRPR